MNKTIRLAVAGVVLLAAITLRCLGVNTYVEGMGFLAAGYLFGTFPQAK